MRKMQHGSSGDGGDGGLPHSIDEERAVLRCAARPRLLKAQRRMAKTDFTSDACCTPQWLPRRVAPVERLPRELSGALLLHGVTCCGGCWGGNFFVTFLTFLSLLTALEAVVVF